MQPIGRMQSGYYPPAPTNGMSPSFSLFRGLQQQPLNQRQQLVNRIQAQIMGQGPAQNVGEGLGQIMSGVALNIAKRNAAFPEAPGGGSPSFGTGLMNFFTGGRNGGLY